MSIILFLLVVFSVVGFIVACALAHLWLDRAAVRVLRLLDLPVYPTAVMIAMSVVKHPDEWDFQRHTIDHKIIGSIWTSNAAYGIYVDTPAGRWRPGFIERRIIREAVDWRLSMYIQSRLQQAMMQHTQSGKITDVT